MARLGFWAVGKLFSNTTSCFETNFLTALLLLSNKCSDTMCLLYFPVVSYMYADMSDAQ